MEIIRLEDPNSPIFQKVCQWNYHWWGKKNNKTMEEIECIFRHSLCKGNRLPQTFVALLNGEAVGMYQLSMHDDLSGRPDIYPWLINVYVDEKHRGKQISRALMETVKENAKQAGIKELHLYTGHVGLYEKFGWEFVGPVETFHPESPIERLYRMNID